MASRWGRFRERARRRAGQALIVAGQVTEYVAPAVAGYALGPSYGAAIGAGAGAAGELQIASGRRLAGKKRQNVRVRVRQGATRGAVIGFASGGARAAVDYLTSSSSTVPTTNPQTTTVSASSSPGSASTQGAKPITVTKAGSTVEFDTSTGAATVKPASGGSTLLDPKALLTGGLPGLVSAGVGLLGQPGGGPLNLPGGIGVDFGGIGSTDPSSASGGEGAFALSPALLVVVAAVVLLVVLR